MDRGTATGPPDDFLALVWDAARKHRLLARSTACRSGEGMTLRSCIEDESTIVSTVDHRSQGITAGHPLQSAVSATQSRVTAAAFGGKQILEATRQEIAALEPIPLVLVVGGAGAGWRATRYPFTTVDIAGFPFNGRHPAGGPPSV